MRRSRPLSARVVAGLLVSLALPVVGCDPGSQVVPDDGEVDAPELDGGAPVDAGTTLDATVPIDAGWDAGHSEPEDAGEPDATDDVDSGVVCPVCTPSSSCVTSTCVDGACVEAPVVDGLECDEAGASICVSGACVLRACGDGFREPGPSSMRESCDDGNLVDGDGCDASCVAEPRTIGTDPSGASEPLPSWKTTSLGVDGDGNLLAIFVRERSGGSELRAARFDARGPFLPSGVDDGTVLVDGNLPTPSQAEPTVVGLRDGGWAVAWTALRGMTYDVVFRLVEVDGTVGDEIVLNELREQGQNGVSLAPLGAGFVAAWTSSRIVASDPDGGVVGRIFGANGTPLTGDFAIAIDRAGSESTVRLASFGTGWIAAFVRQDAARGYLPYVRVRRFSGESPIEFVDAELGEGDEPSIASLDDGSFVLVRTAYAVDFRGDVVARVVPGVGPIGTSDEVVAATGNLIERSPFVTSTPAGGVLVSHRIGNGYTFAPALGLSLPAEAIALRAVVAADAIERPTLARTRSGVAIGYRGFDASAPTYVFSFHLLGLP